MRPSTYRNEGWSYRRKLAHMILVSEDPEVVDALYRARDFRYLQVKANEDDDNVKYYQYQRLYFLALRPIMPHGMADILLDHCINNGETVRYNLHLMAARII